MITAENYLAQVPADVLAKIFTWAMYLYLDLDDTCPQCRRPYYFRLAGPTACAIRSTCRLWRDVFCQKIMVVGITAPNQPWCITPMQCCGKFAERIATRVATVRPVMYYVPDLDRVNFVPVGSGAVADVIAGEIEFDFDDSSDDE